MPAGRLFDEEFLARLQRLGLIAKRMPAASSASGQRRGRRLGDGLEFADHRAYAPGDDLRFLDWPYYARMERLLLRMFHEHSEGAVTLLVDCSASMGLGDLSKFDYARRTAAALAYVAMVGLDRVNILPFADTLHDGMRTGRNRGQILQVLEFLEALGAGGPTCLGPSVELLVRQYPEVQTVLVISDMLEAEDDLADALAALRQRKDQAIVLHVVDRCDCQPPLVEAAQLTSVEGGRRMNVQATAEVLASYARKWQEFVGGLEKTCLSRGAVYIQAPTWAPFERLVLQTLQKAGFLQG
jgi:uncharacterized protein (DUF58 family)